MKYGLCTDVTIENIDGQSILITKNGDAAVLNETAHTILSYVLNGVDCTSTATKLADVYHIDEHTISEDMKRLVSELVDKKLIRAL